MCARTLEQQRDILSGKGRCVIYQEGLECEDKVHSESGWRRKFGILDGERLLNYNEGTCILSQNVGRRKREDVGVVRKGYWSTGVLSRRETISGLHLNRCACLQRLGEGSHGQSQASGQHTLPKVVGAIEV